MELELITFTFPQSAYEAYLMMVPVITLLLGLAFFFMPGRMLALLGVEAQSDRPAAKGAGRYLFASFMLALALCCLFVQEPQALQPGLNITLGIAWIFTALGIVGQVLKAGKWDTVTIVSICFALNLGLMALSTADGVGLAWLQSSQTSFGMRGVMYLTFGLGLCLNYFPKKIFSLLGLQERVEGDGSNCVLVGLPAGFISAVGFGVLFFNDPPIASLFVQIVMGLGWLIMGIGLLISMLFDAKFPKGLSVSRILMTIAALGMGTYCLLKILGYL